ncbi:polysaccharide biosynthesis/export family protein [Phenylobacterium sp.]|uniref:SLBB domain-containing protein n=1 Tax=Phenylobacterium sp. TaxID=1871053 RepID=UPI00273730BB|nr:polysaccharide biosynthesis/export family protein [Phenylobacterium sp.]MDP3854026.1 polysaccharide biosynthesis/export family protein [Phenylobacterium sp.]
MQIRTTLIKFAMALCLVGILPASAGAQTPAAVAPPVVPLTGAQSTAKAAPAADDEYIVGPEDVIEVEVVGLPDRARTKVYTDGTIQLNLLGKVQVAGQTPRQLGDQLAKLLKDGGFYANPVVNVEVVSFASRYVTVLGAVGAPGLVPINRAYRMSEILARVGGVTGAAAEYLVVRPESGPEQRYFIRDLATGDASKDPFVQAGDKIYAPLADIFYISGQVRAPGTFPIAPGMTIGQAIARSGGLTESGNGKKIEVTRAGKKLKLDPSAKVEPEDVLVVKERLF